MLRFAAIKTIDHLVITCKDIPTTVAWYERYLGMRSEVFGTCIAGSEENVQKQQRTALKYGSGAYSQKINLHQRGREFEPKATTALPGTADLCFEVGDEVKLEDVLTALKAEGEGKIVFEASGEIVERTGAKGKMRSIYVRDPDGNLVELSKYDL